MSTEKEKNTTLNKLINSLNNKDPELVVKALNTIHEKGSVELIKPLIELGKKRSEKEIQDGLQRILFGLKISAAHPIIIDEMKQMGPHPFRKVLLSTIWEANINALDQVDELVKIAIEGDLYEAIEVQTILEESEGELNEEKILESLLILKNLEADNTSFDPAKEVFISSIKDKLEQWNKGLQ